MGSSPQVFLKLCCKYVPKLSELFLFYWQAAYARYKFIIDLLKYICDTFNYSVRPLCFSYKWLLLVLLYSIAWWFLFFTEKQAKPDLFKMSSTVLGKYKLAEGCNIAESQSKMVDGHMEDRHPKSMKRPKVWTEEVEEAYRFQLAGYRDELEYHSVTRLEVTSILCLFICTWYSWINSMLCRLIMAMAQIFWGMWFFLIQIRLLFECTHTTGD